jgi:hypothetical protein
VILDRCDFRKTEICSSGTEKFCDFRQIVILDNVILDRVDCIGMNDSRISKIMCSKSQLLEVSVTSSISLNTTNFRIAELSTYWMSSSIKDLVETNRIRADMPDKRLKLELWTAVFSHVTTHQKWWRWTVA